MKTDSKSQALTPILPILAACFLAGAFGALAQSFRITAVQEPGTGQIRIDYQSDAVGAFRLLRGPTVTNIATYVATNVGSTASGSFLQPLLAGINSAAGEIQGTAFYRVERIATNTANVPLTFFTSSPANGEADVSVNRETILRFSNPLAIDSIIDQNNFFASFGGRQMLSRVEISSDRRTVTLFYLETVPASARIRVLFVGDSVLDHLGRPVDADGDGLPGGIALIDYDTLSITPVGQTAIVGRVFASELLPDPTGTQGTVNKPLPGVTITVDGAEETLRAVTDSDGNFRLQPCPAGKFFVHIDGRTSPLSQYPNGDYYPFVGKQWESAAGWTNNLAGGTGEIFLPLIPEGTLQPVSATADTQVTFAPSVVASNAALEGVSITVPANALFSDNGARGGRVGIAPVSPDRLPGPLPPGLQFPIVITVQTDGALNFDRPVAACFPNLPNPATGRGVAPGGKSYLYSFNHDNGEWEPVGSMTASQDGATICTDPGIGIVQPGWHGTMEGAFGTGGECHNKDDPCCGLRQPPEAYCAAAILQCIPLIFNGGCVPGVIGSGKPGAGCIQFGVDIFHCRRIFTKLCECSSAQAASGQATKLANAQQANRTSDPRIREILSLVDASIPILSEIGVIHANALLAGSFSPSDDETLLRLRDALDAIAGADYQDRLRRLYNEVLAELASPPMQFWESTSGDRTLRVPPRFFVAQVNGQRFRGRTDSVGRFSLFMGPDADGVPVGIYDPIENRAATTYGYPVVNGQSFEFPPYTLTNFPGEEDTDGDRISDMAEDIVGTDPNNPDTDGDGISDSAEIDNGTNPLDGLAVATGIIASADTPGTAVDICAINNIAVVADSAAGVTVFNVTAGQNPVRIAQVDTPGTALAVSCSGNLIAVADGSEGLQVIDISDPPAARIVRSIPMTGLGGNLGLFGVPGREVAQAVATAADLAFVGTTVGVVSMIELSTGTVLQRLALGGKVEDLAIEGTTLYAYAAGRLYVLSFAAGPMTLASSVSISGAVNTEHGRGRLFVGDSVAYVVRMDGYSTLDVTNPSNPTLIHQGTTTQRGWKQIVPNGSGLGLAAVGLNFGLDGPHDVWLYDTSDPRSTDSFITRFETPGIARAVSIYNGLGYVADDGNGMHVVNYLAYDSKKRPPTAVLSTSSTNGTATVGGLVVLRAAVKDDVQVRNVEFVLDGRRIALDGNFPFETVYRVPTNVVGGQLAFSANVFDTGGNTVFVTNSPIIVVPDNLAPAVLVEWPTEGQTILLGDELFVRVATIDNVGIASIAFSINGVHVPALRISLSSWILPLPESLGAHRLIATATDTAGLTGASAPVTFVVAQPRPEAVSREYTAFNAGADDRRQSVSREYSTFNAGKFEPDEAVSREYSAFNVGLGERHDAVSREYSLSNNPTGPAGTSSALRSSADSAIEKGFIRRAAPKQSDTTFTPALK